MEWTQQEKDDFTFWHEKRLVDLTYPESIVTELCQVRIRWLSTIKEPKIEVSLEKSSNNRPSNLSHPPA